MLTRISRNLRARSGRAAASWRRLRPLFGGRPGAIAVLLVTSALTGVAEAGILAVIAQVAATLVNGTSRVHVALGPITVDQTVGVLLAIGGALAVVRLALQAVISYIPARAAADMQARLRTQVFAAFTDASWTVQSTDREGYLQEILTNQIGLATAGVLQALGLLTTLLTFAVLVVVALLLNVVAAVIVLAAATVLFVALRPLSAIGDRRSQGVARGSIEYAGEVNQAVRLAEETQVFGVADAQRSRLDGVNLAVRRLYLHAQLIVRVVPGIYQSLVYILLIAALAFLYGESIGHVVSLGAVILVLVRAGTYGQMLQSSYQYLLQAAPFLDLVKEAADRYAASRRVTGSRPLEKVRSLALENVSFGYKPDRQVLSDVAFEVSGGESIGIVGPSGAGKSTIVQILLGLRDPTTGRYLVNGCPATDFRREDWHRRFAYVPQEPQLLHASVAENIRFFRPLDDAAVEQAAKLAGIHDDIMTWSSGYDTVVGPRADAVSGGQQQRLCLARALADLPEVLVLDEPTSALDPRSEALIHESLAMLKHRLTLFVVAHRMRLEMCDRVMVIVDGRLEAFDREEALHAISPYYRSASDLTARAYVRSS